MIYNIYIICFDKGNPPSDMFNYKKFHIELTTADGVINWWHHLQSSYIIVTESNILASNVADYVRERMPNKLFFVSELNLQNHNGWLPEKAWEWINRFM